MSSIPKEIEDLLRERQAARANKDFARADRLRDEIGELGWEVRDDAGGATAVPKQKFDVVDPSAPGLVSRVQITAKPPRAISICVSYEGFRDDLARFIGGFQQSCDAHDYVIVVVDAGSDDGEWIESLKGDHVATMHFAHDPGWARKMNVAMKSPVANARLSAVADLSVEATGDILGPILEAFEDPRTGVAGPWGITTTNLRDFDASNGPEVDAIEGYFLATRREILDEVSFDEKFRWYRHADIDFSFQVRSLGFMAVVTAPLGERHTHRGWTGLENDPDERDRRSRKNFNRFLEHFRGRDDLLMANKDRPPV